MNRTFRAGWLTMLWLFAVVAGLMAQTTVQETLSRADKQFDLYAYNLALRTYEQVIKEQPNNAHALARIGDCHFQLNQPQNALSWYDRAVLRDDVEPEVMLRYGKALMQTGDYIGAKKWFVMYSGKNPSVGQHFAQMCDFALQASRKDGLFQALNEPLNTEAADYSPAYYGSKVVYNSARTDIKRKTASKTNSDWTGSAYNQLYVTQRTSGSNYLQTPAFLRDDLQSNFNEGPVTFSADGRRVVYCRNNFIDGTRQIAEKGVNMSLYIADVVDGAWMNERALPFNGSDYATGFPCLSPDGNTLYFASTQAGGFGGWDIYVSTWNGGAWSTPRNMGTPLNTAGNEVTPFFDGANLYFASDWHNGLGGMDVFRAEMANNNVQAITHLGAGINSSRDDYGFIFDARENTGYLTSNRPEGRGNEDIWQVRKKVDEFTIVVLDPQRNPISGADIDFSACNAGIKQTDANGRYSFAVASGKADCRVTVRRAGYQSAVLPIQSSGDKDLTAVLMPEYGTTPAPSTNTAPVTYSADDYAVQSGSLLQFTIYVRDDQGRPIPGAELNLGACGLATVYTDYYGKGSFYFPQGANCSVYVRKSGLEDVMVPLNDRTSREISVTMGADQRSKYNGLVLDAATRRGVPGAVVTAKSRQGNHETLATSNVSGQYTLLLRPYQIYDITYTRDGYKGFTSLLRTERAVTTDMDLSPVALEPSYSAASNAPVTYSTTPPSGGMISLADLDELASGMPTAPTKTPSPVTRPDVIPVASGQKVNGYAVQLSAGPESFSEDRLRRYDAFTKHGNLYSVKEGANYKLRLGVYPTRADADAVLDQVTPAIKDAFVVSEAHGDQSMVVRAPTGLSEPVAVKGLSSTPSTSIRFAVQVASWPADRAVLLTDYANLNSLGNPYLQPENDRLRVRVGTWDTHAKAEVIQAEAIRLGYKDAIIVTEKVEDLPNDRLLTAPGTLSPKGQLIASPAQYSTPSTIKATPATSSNAKYYVRVCALEDTYNFDVRKLEGAGGVIEKWPIGDTKKTAIMLTGYPDVGQAMVATDHLRSKGFLDAYIIQDENGRMSKYRY